MQRLADFLRGLADAIRPIAEQLGGPGLALIAFADSSFLSLPEVNDVLIVVLVIEHPSRWLYYAALTTMGSMAGCFALYSIGRKGGEAVLRRRFRERHVERALATFRRYGLLTIMVPSMLPPPTPFKIFVLLAGVAGVRRRTFLFAIAVGRGLRYGGEAFLAYRYGAQASVFISEHLPAILTWAAVGIGVVAGGVVLWRRLRRPASGVECDPESRDA